MAITKEINITVNSEKAVKGINDVDKSLKNVKTSGSQTNESLSSTALASAKSFKVMGVSINGVSSMLKVLKVSLIATGIGAIVVVVGTLAAAFLSTQSGVDKLNSVLTPLKEVLATIWGITQKLGEGLFQMVSGDVQKGWESMGKAVENVGDQMDKAWQNGVKLHNLQMQIRENNVSDSLVISRLNRLRADQLEIAEDINKTAEERRNAYKAAISSEEAITKLKKRQNELLIEEATRKTKANDTDDAAKQALNELIAQGEDIEAQGIKRRTLLLKKLNVVKGEAPDLKQGETFNEYSKRQEDIKKKIEQDALERQRINEENLQKNQDLQSYLDEEEKIITDAEDRRVNAAFKAAQEEARIKILFEENVQIAKENLVTNGLNLLGSLAKKGSALAKGVAIAEVVRSQVASVSGIISNTAVANAKAAAASPLTAGQPFVAINTISAGLGIAGGLVGAAKAIKDINSEKKTPSGGTITGGGGGGVAAPSFNLVQGTQGNQIANSINQQNSQPLKAYVVSGDMTSQQSLDRNAKTNSSL